VSSPSGRYQTPVDFGVVPLDGSHVVARAVLVASDVRLYSEGLALVFARDGRLFVSQVAPTAERAVERLAESRPDALLLDASMPDVRVVVHALRDQVPRIPIILFGVPALDEDLLDCIDAGAAMFVSRDASSEDLIEAVLSALAGESMQSRGMASVLG
jgi:two-component system invasion response regulator UvrY